MKKKFVIIGSGPCGIGSARRLLELGITDFVILEKENHVGGLAASFVDPQGFTWDIGGHVQFSHYDYFDQAMELSLGRSGWLNHQRESWVWMKDRFIPYPFQNNIHRLPEQDCQECYSTIPNNPPKRTPQNFDEWMHDVFGQGIVRHFMGPYNFKVWAHPASEMSYHWIGERVSLIDKERIRKNIELKQDDVSWGPNNTFQFPKEGGTGAIWKSLALPFLEKILFDHSVNEIDSENKKVITANGSVFEYENLISTMPLDLLCKKTTSLSSNKKELANGLLHSSSHIIGIGLDGRPHKDLESKCWMYFPEDNCPFYRVTLFSKYSPFNVPNSKTQYSLMAEVSESQYKAVDDSSIVQETIDGLRATKLINENDRIASTWYHKASYGYPIPSKNRDAILEEVIPALEDMNIFSRGRFGAWKYEISNQDHTFMQGIELINRLINQEKEATFKLK